MSEKNKKKAYSHLGGQAVLEGVMMRNAETGQCAVAVRMEDGSISVNKYLVNPQSDKGTLAKIPIIRGVAVFVDSLVTGMKAMNISADLYAGDEGETGKETEEGPGKDSKKELKERLEEGPETATEQDARDGSDPEENLSGTGDPSDYGENAPEGDLSDAPESRPEGNSYEIRENAPDGKASDTPESRSKDNASDSRESRSKGNKAGASKGKSSGSAGESVLSAMVTVLALGIGVFLFIVLPFLIVSLLKNFILNDSVLAIIEGILRVVIFILYILAISMMKDIRHTFCYHGAEHKCINCVEKGYDLTVENVRSCPRSNRRCGTSFLILVMLVSVVVFFFIRVDNYVLKIVLRLLLIPLIAGISYEIIRISSRSDNAFFTILSSPGLMLQKLTVKEPDDEMIEVGIASVEAVFDWREFKKEKFGEDYTPEPDDAGEAGKNSKPGKAGKNSKPGETADSPKPGETAGITGSGESGSNVDAGGTQGINNTRSPEELSGRADISADSLLSAMDAANKGVEASDNLADTGSVYETAGQEVTADTANSILREAIDILEKVGVPEAEMDARVLLKQVTGLGREDLLLSGDEPIANVTREKFMELVGRRATREPLQLVVGAAPFMGFDFTVTPGVLIPRFDTEILVEEAMKTLESGANVLDLCTGTGCVLISLLRYSNETNGVGTDISDIALETAGKNSEDLVENGRVTWLKGDLFDALDREKYKSYFEMITANPPYIKSGDIAGLMPEVRDHEPREALDGGEDGLDLYRRIISEAPYFLKGGAQLLLEIGYDQAQQVRELLEQNGFVDITVTRDYSGNDRVVSARRKISVEGSDAE